MTPTVPEFVNVVVSDGSQDAGLAMLLLSRPPTNAMTRQVYREVVAAANELGRRDDVAAVILYGGHEIFSAGDDMPELRTLSAQEADTAARIRQQAVDAVAAIPADRGRHHRIRVGCRPYAGPSRRLASQR